MKSEENYLKVFSPDKSAAITLISGQQLSHIEEVTPNSWAFLFPDTKAVKDALQAFFDDTPLPCKSFSDLTKSLRQQMHTLKNQRGKR
jgi:hypothetical protein